MSLLEKVEEGTYIQFLWAGYSSTGKTKVWRVATLEDEKDVLGEISFDAGWWKYSFFPYSQTKFEWVCMREIADFCEKQTKLWRKKIVEAKKR